ncbi:MAG: hypothetical protein AAF487_11910 [Bacteroidota bacterium]
MVSIAFTFSSDLFSQAIKFDKFPEYETGTPMNAVNSVHFDNENQILWIGTHFGLVGYDGTDYFKVKFPDSFKVKSRDLWVKDIVKAKNNNDLIIGTNNEVYRMSTRNLKDLNPTQIGPTLKEDLKQFILLGSSLIILTEKDNLFKYEITPPYEYEEIIQDSLGISAIGAFNNTLYIGSNSGIITRYIDTILDTIYIDEEVTQFQSNENSIFVSTNQNIYVLYTKNIVNQNRITTINPIPDPGEMENYGHVFLRGKIPNEISNFSLTPDESEIWLNNSIGEVYRGSFDSGTKLAILEKIDCSLSDFCYETINDVFIDSKKRVWFATDGGLFKYDPKKQFVSTLATEDAKVWSILRNQNDELIIGTDNGIFIDNRQLDFLFNNKIPEPNNVQVSSIVELDGNYFFGLRENFYGRGYFCKSYKGKMKISQCFDTINENELGSIRLVLKDTTTKNLWIGTYRTGLLRYSYSNRDPIIESASRVNDSIESVSSLFLNTKDSSLWIGTDKNGLWNYKINDDSLAKYNPGIPSIEKKIIMAIFLSSNDNTPWLGLMNYGLYYGDEPIIPNISVWNILEDSSKNNLWISTNKWLICIEDYNSSKRNIHYFNDSWGVNNIDFNGKASFIDQDTIWFGGNHGVDYFDTEGLFKKSQKYNEDYSTFLLRHWNNEDGTQNDTYFVFDRDSEPIGLSLQLSPKPLTESSSEPKLVKVFREKTFKEFEIKPLDFSATNRHKLFYRYRRLKEKKDNQEWLPIPSNLVVPKPNPKPNFYSGTLILEIKKDDYQSTESQIAEFKFIFRKDISELIATLSVVFLAILGALSYRYFEKSREKITKLEEEAKFRELAVENQKAEKKLRMKADVEKYKANWAITELAPELVNSQESADKLIISLRDKLDEKDDKGNPKIINFSAFGLAVDNAESQTVEYTYFWKKNNNGDWGKNKPQLFKYGKGNKICSFAVSLVTNGNIPENRIVFGGKEKMKFMKEYWDKDCPEVSEDASPESKAQMFFLIIQDKKTKEKKSKKWVLTVQSNNQDYYADYEVEFIENLKPLLKAIIDRIELENLDNFYKFFLEVKPQNFNAHDFYNPRLANKKRGYKSEKDPFRHLFEIGFDDFFTGIKIIKSDFKLDQNIVSKNTREIKLFLVPGFEEIAKNFKQLKLTFFDITLMSYLIICDINKNKKFKFDRLISRSDLDHIKHTFEHKVERDDVINLNDIVVFQLDKDVNGHEEIFLKFISDLSKLFRTAFVKKKDKTKFILKKISINRSELIFNFGDEISFKEVKNKINSVNSTHPDLNSINHNFTGPFLRINNIYSPNNIGMTGAKAIGETVLKLSPENGFSIKIKKS